MGLAIQGLQGLAGIASLICFVLVIIAMFQNQQSTLGIVCLVLIFCVGIGGLIAFVYGWMRSSEWGIKNIMLIWTIAIIIGLVGGGASVVVGP